MWAALIINRFNRVAPNKSVLRRGNSPTKGGFFFSPGGIFWGPLYLAAREMVKKVKMPQREIFPRDPG